MREDLTVLLNKDKLPIEGATFKIECNQDQFPMRNSNSAQLVEEFKSIDQLFNLSQCMQEKSLENHLANSKLREDFPAISHQRSVASNTLQEEAL
jgi:hypothetical protein